MIYLVAGGVFVVSLAVAVLSCLYAPRYRERAAGAGNEAARPADDQNTRGRRFSWPWRIAALSSAALCACLAAVIAAGRAGAVEKARYIIAAEYLLSALFFDQRSRLIPNALTLAAFICGAVCSGASFAVSREAALGELLRCLLGAVCCFCAFYLMSRFIHDGMGLGDVKLIAVLAWLIGLSASLYSVLFGLIACAVVSVVLVAIKKLSRNSRVPFAPFVFLGYAVTILLSF